MRFPDSLRALLEEGIIEEVVRPLLSGKEAQVYLVISEGQERVAKVYKDAQQRSFKNRADYTEGRKVRNSRDQRAMDRGSRHGKAQNEAAWKSTEVDMIYRLSQAGVRVPKPYHFIDGVFIMELVCDAEGQPAPRLGELTYTAEEATVIFEYLLGQVVLMLCAGVVHGDLSDFNVLVDHEGPVIIDFPQAIDASRNQNARAILVRDVANLQRFVERFAPNSGKGSYAQEIWHLYERGELTPTTRLTGKFAPAHRKADTHGVVDLIEDAKYDIRMNNQDAAVKPRRKRRKKRGAAPMPTTAGASASAPTPARSPSRPPAGGGGNTRGAGSDGYSRSGAGSPVGGNHLRGGGGGSPSGGPRGGGGSPATPRGGGGSRGNTRGGGGGNTRGGGNNRGGGGNTRGGGGGRGGPSR